MQSVMIATGRTALVASLVSLALARGANADDATTPLPLRLGMWDQAGWHHDGLFIGDRQVDLDEFLLVAGRQDVVDRIDQRRRLRLGLVVGGALVGLGGLVYAVTRASCDSEVNEPGPGNALEDCNDARAQRGLLGTLTAFAGGGLIIGGVTASDRRPGRAELRAIARASNRAGAPAADAAVVIAPADALRSAGVVLTLAF